MRQRFEAKLPAASEWFDLWHTHVDWRGEGNADQDVRRECLLTLFAAWPRVEELGSATARPWQSWVVVAVTDSGQDAVYLHTPNPNRDNFPYAFTGVAWGVMAPAWLAEVIPAGAEVGRSEFDGVPLLWVRRSANPPNPALQQTASTLAIPTWLA